MRGLLISLGGYSHFGRSDRRMKVRVGEVFNMEPINVEFEWKLSDYHEAQQVYAKRGRIFLRILRGLFLGLCLLGLVLVAGAATYYQVWSNPEAIRLTLSFVALSLFWAFAPKLQEFMQKRFFKLDRLEGKALSYRISENDIFMCGPDAESKVKWTHFNRWMEGPRLYVLMAGRLMYMVPKDRLGDRVEDLRALLTEKIGPQGKTRK